MKKAILFTIIGATIIFAWNFLSFAFPNFHRPSSAYTAAQEEILEAIEKSGLKEGMYKLGQPGPEFAAGSEYIEAKKAYEAKPFAILNYQMEYTSSNTMSKIRLVIIDLLIALIFFWIIRQQKDGTLLKRVLLGVGIGFIGFLSLPYTGFIWSKEPDIWAYMLDCTVPWALLGIVGHKLA